VTLLARSS